LAQQPPHRGRRPEGHQRGAGIEQLLGAAASRRALATRLPPWRASGPRCGRIPHRTSLLNRVQQWTNQPCGSCAHGGGWRAPKAQKPVRQPLLPPFTAVIRLACALVAATGLLACAGGGWHGRTGGRWRGPDPSAGQQAVVPTAPWPMADLVQADLREADLSGAQLQRANLSGRPPGWRPAQRC